MKMGLVSRKTYEILQNNCKMINEQRMKVEKENIELQKQIIDLKRLIITYKGTQKEAIKCKNCDNYFVPKTKSNKYCPECKEKNNKKVEE